MDFTGGFQDEGENLIADQAPVGGGKVPAYIGYPGVQKAVADVPNDLFRKDMEKRFMIARIVPMVQQNTFDHNSYAGKLAWGINADKKNNFTIDLMQNSGNDCMVPQQQGEFRIVLSSLIPINETYSNEYGTDELYEGMSSPLSGGLASSLAFHTNTTKIFGSDNDSIQGKFDNMLKKSAKKQKKEKGKVGTATNMLSSGMDMLKAGQAKINDMIKQAENSGDANMQKLARVAREVGSALNKPGSKVNWPLIWKDCSFQQQYECTTRLYAYNSMTKQEYNDNIMAPIAVMQQFVCPRSEDGWLYQWPYMCTFDIYGCVHMPLAYISNLSVIKGGDVGDFSCNGRPNIVDLRFTVSSIYSVCVNTNIDNEKDNPYRPSISKDQRGLASYRNKGATLSPMLNGSPNDKNTTKSTLKLAKTKTDIYNEADKKAAELKKANDAGNKNKVLDYTKFLYSQVDTSTNTQNNVAARNVKEAQAFNQKKAQNDAQNAQNAAQADIESEQAAATQNDKSIRRVIKNPRIISNLSIL